MSSSKSLLLGSLLGEAGIKRALALEAAGSFVTNDPADVRWLLCGRARPVAAGTSPYAVELSEETARVWYQDIERSRVEAEERWQELGYGPMPYPWHEELPAGAWLKPGTSPDAAGAWLKPGTGLGALRIALLPPELQRYRAAGADAAAAFVEALSSLRPDMDELEAAGELT